MFYIHLLGYDKRFSTLFWYTGKLLDFNRYVFFLNGIFDNISDVKRLNLLYVLCKFTITLNYIVCRTLSLHVNNKLQLGSPPRYNLPLKHLQV